MILEKKRNIHEFRFGFVLALLQYLNHDLGEMNGVLTIRVL